MIINRVLWRNKQVTDRGRWRIGVQFQYIPDSKVQITFTEYHKCGIYSSLC